MYNDLAPMKSDEDRISEKIDGLVRTLHYKNQPDVVNSLCLLKGRLCLAKRLSDKERKTTTQKIEQEVRELQLSVA